MSEGITYFVGQKEVEQIHAPDGTNLVGVLYTDGSNEDFTTEQWEAVKSLAKYETGQVMLKKHEALMVRIIRELVKSRVTIGEQNWILERIAESIGNSYRSAIAALFKQPFTEKIMLGQIDVVLKAAEEEKKKTEGEEATEEKKKSK